MSRTAYIALLIYIPLLIFFMLFTADSNLADWAWFTSDKVMMIILLVALREKEITPNRKSMYGAAAVAMAVYVLYLTFDFSGAHRTSLFCVAVISIIYILSLIYTIIKHDRQNKR